jgi:hypothetical protein
MPIKRGMTESPERAVYVRIGCSPIDMDVLIFDRAIPYPNIYRPFRAFIKKVFPVSFQYLPSVFRPIQTAKHP